VSVHSRAGSHVEEEHKEPILNNDSRKSVSRSRSPMDEDEDSPILKSDLKKSTSRSVSPPEVEEEEEEPILPSPNHSRSGTNSPNNPSHQSRDSTPMKRRGESSEGGSSKRMRMDRRVISLFFERCFDDVLMDELVTDDIVLEQGDTPHLLMAKLKRAKLSIKLDPRLFEKRDDSRCLVKHNDEVLKFDSNLDDIPNSGKLLISFEVRIKFVSSFDNHFVMVNVDTESDIATLKQLVSNFTEIPSRQLNLVFEDDRAMEDDGKYLSDFKDFLLDPVTVSIYYSRIGMDINRVKQTARKSLVTSPGSVCVYWVSYY
jgi:hypothetical protein